MSDKRAVDISWAEERDGRWTLHKQIGGQRRHMSWPSKEAVLADVDAFLKLHARRFDLVGLAERLGKGESPDGTTNIGPKGLISFRDFVVKEFPNVRNQDDVKRSLNAMSWSREQQRISQLLEREKPPFVDRALHEIGSDELKEWLDEYRNRVQVTTGNSLHRWQQLFRNIFSGAVQLGFLRESPAVKIKTATIRPAQRSRIQIESVARVCREASPEIRAHILLGVFCGLERFEQDSLRVDNISMQDARIRLRGSHRKRESREMPVHPDLLDALRPMVKNARPDAPVFRDAAGKPARLDYRDWKKACLRASVEPFTPLHARDLFRALLRNPGGADSDLIEILMGHRLRGLRKFYGGDDFPEENVRQVFARLPRLSEAKTGSIPTRTPMASPGPVGNASEVPQKVATGKEAQFAPIDQQP